MPNMPLLPKQPVVLYMGRELISKEGLELIRDGISEVTKLESACMANTILGGSYHVQPVIPEQTEREKIRREHAKWSDATFGNVGPVGPLKHLSKEALEAAADPSDPLEWADMQFLLWDAQRRMGISDDFITKAMIEKLEINKKRQWPEPKDGEPRLHIKKQLAQPVSEHKPVGYFSYGSECGFDWHNTEKEAIESAEAAIDDYRGDACDGWSEETDSVCWGVILQQATKVDERPRTDDDKCDPAIDTVCDYALLPARED